MVSAARQVGLAKQSHCKGCCYPQTFSWQIPQSVGSPKQDVPEAECVSFFSDLACTEPLFVGCVASQQHASVSQGRIRLNNCLVGLVVKASASGAEVPGFESRWRRGFSGIESYQ